MIHLDFADGTSAWLTDEQLKEQHPELYAALRQPAPHKEYGQKLRDIRVKHDISQREMARLAGCKTSELSAVESGREPATPEMIEAYQRLQQE